ncbi:CU044_5270 family protein [Streptomyces sp. NPDC048639]|uniref:CU044_5270 family protein n=1 Tax=Streptomyces sp. NPDC048639 TaxID=3365581 RepID=UPI00371BE906
MNDLNVLREWDAEAQPLTDDARLRARARLFREMNGTRGASPAVPLFRRPVLRTVVAVAAAAAVATTAVVALDDGGGRSATEASPRADAPQMQPVSAATVLNAAAARERKQDPTVAPRDDQFIYTKEIIKEIDRKTHETKSYVDESWRSVDDSKRSWVMEIGRGWWADPLKPNESLWPPSDWDTLKKLPTDPDELILAARFWPEERPKSVDEIPMEEWGFIQSLLDGLLSLTPVMPEGLRAAAFEALAKVPGITATSGMKDAKGRSGIGISFKDPTGEWHSHKFAIFAEGTYEFLGFKDVRTSDSAAGRKTYTQLSYLDRYAVVDHAKQRP